METPLDGENGAYRFKYTGLKLLARTKTSYLLRTGGEAAHVNIFLTHSPDLRFELSNTGLVSEQKVGKRRPRRRYRPPAHKRVNGGRAC